MERTAAPGNGTLNRQNCEIMTIAQQNPAPALSAVEIAGDRVLRVLCKALRERYGPRIERIVLFGSRARGDAREDSDYDVAVFLHGLTDWELEVDRLSYIQLEVIDATGEFAHTQAFPAGAWANRTMLMGEIRSEGRDL